MARTVLDTAIFLDTMTNRSLGDEAGRGDDAAAGAWHTPMPGWEDLPMVPHPLTTGKFETWRHAAELGIAQAQDKTAASFKVAFSTLRVNAVTPETERLCRRAAEVLASDSDKLVRIEEPFDVKLACLLFIILRSVGYNTKFGKTSVLTPEQRNRYVPNPSNFHPPTQEESECACEYERVRERFSAEE